MGRFIIVSFGVLAWVFWEMSGGADFVPEQRVAAADPADAETPRLADSGSQEVVTRTDGLQLTRVTADEPALLVQQASLTQTDTLLAQRAEEARSGDLAQAATEARNDPEVAEPVFESLARSDAPPADMRKVAGSWVNLRTGPGTSHGRITALPGGAEVEVLEVDASGWARLRVVESQQIGWMAERLLTDADT